jgi:hypothetical protein
MVERVITDPSLNYPSLYEVVPNLTIFFGHVNRSPPVEDFILPLFFVGSLRFASVFAAPSFVHESIFRLASSERPQLEIFLINFSRPRISFLS